MAILSDLPNTSTRVTGNAQVYQSTQGIQAPLESQNRNKALIIGSSEENKVAYRAPYAMEQAGVSRKPLVRPTRDSNRHAGRPTIHLSHNLAITAASLAQAVVTLSTSPVAFPTSESPTVQHDTKSANLSGDKVSSKRPTKVRFMAVPGSHLAKQHKLARTPRATGLPRPRSVTSTPPLKPPGLPSTPTPKRRMQASEIECSWDSSFYDWDYKPLKGFHPRSTYRCELKSLCQFEDSEYMDDFMMRDEKVRQAISLGFFRNGEAGMDHTTGLVGKI